MLIRVLANTSVGPVSSIRFVQIGLAFDVVSHFAVQVVGAKATGGLHRELGCEAKYTGLPAT